MYTLLMPCTPRRPYRVCEYITHKLYEYEKFEFNIIFHMNTLISAGQLQYGRLFK